MTRRMKRWLGFGSAPAIGVRVQDDGMHVALVRADPTAVVGLGHVPLPPGAVVDGQVRRPGEVGRVIESVLGSLHWSERPILHLVVDPIPWSGVDRAEVVAAPVRDRVDGGTEAEMGTLAAAEQVVNSIVLAAQASGATVGTVEPTPVAVARFLRLAWPDSGLRFARCSSPGHRWTSCDGDGSLDVELSLQTGGVATLVDGPDPTRMEPTGWGGLVVDRRVRAAVPKPGLAAAAVGAALSHLGHQPTCNLLGPAPGPPGADGFGWAVEQVR